MDSKHSASYHFLTMWSDETTAQLKAASGDFRKTSGANPIWTTFDPKKGKFHVRLKVGPLEAEGARGVRELEEGDDLVAIHRSWQVINSYDILRYTNQHTVLEETRNARERLKSMYPDEGQLESEVEKSVRNTLFHALIKKMEPQENSQDVIDFEAHAPWVQDNRISQNQPEWEAGGSTSTNKPWDLNDICNFD